jgi:DNA-binding IclR family transcriptional regulator
MPDSVPIQSAKTALEILEIVARRNRMTLSELQTAIEMPQSTVHDYLMTLVESGYVVNENGQYRASTRCLDIGVSVRRDMQLFQLAKPEVDSLAEQTDEHASLMIEEQGVGVLLYISKGDRALDLGVSDGHQLALSTTAPGKAILAHMPKVDVEQILDDHGMPQVTKATITDREELFGQLETIRDRGYALDIGERVQGVRAVSVPIITQDTVQGAITISGTTSRMTQDRLTEELPVLLAESADVIQVQHTLTSGRS